MRGTRIHPRDNLHIRCTLHLPKRQRRRILLPVSTGFPLRSCRELRRTHRTNSARTTSTTTGRLRQHLGDRTGSVYRGCVYPPCSASFTIVCLPDRKLFTRTLTLPKLTRRLRLGFEIYMTKPAALTTLIGDLRLNFHALTIRRHAARI